MNSLFLLFPLPGGAEWIIILLAILLLFGGRKIPELMRGLGKGIREFNTAKSSLKSELEEGMREEEVKSTAQKPSAEANSAESKS